jgi:hypothetical protein
MHLLISTRGNMPMPPTASPFPSVIRQRRREHSRKPDRAYQIIEAMYPDLAKIELFAPSPPAFATPVRAPFSRPARDWHHCAPVPKPGVICGRLRQWGQHERQPRLLPAD